MDDVTQADRDAAAQYLSYDDTADLMRWSIPDHLKDFQCLSEWFAAHRQAALLEGIRFGLDAAAADALTWFPADSATAQRSGGVVASIRALDPAVVLAAHRGEG